MNDTRKHLKMFCQSFKHLILNPKIGLTLFYPVTPRGVTFCGVKECYGEIHFTMLSCVMVLAQLQVGAQLGLYTLSYIYNYDQIIYQSL